METAIPIHHQASFIIGESTLVGWHIHHSPSRSFIHHAMPCPPRPAPAHAISFTRDRQAGRLMRAFYLLQPCVTFSTVPSSEVCTFNLRKTQNKQQPGQLFSSSFCFFPAKFLIFYFSLLFPTYLLGLWSMVVISPGLTTRCCSGRSVLAKVWFDDGEVVSQSVTNE